MFIKSILLAGVLVVSAAGLAACDNNNPPPTPPPGPPPPSPVVFNDFVKSQFDNTADDTDPVAVDTTDFAFLNEDDPNAFDDVLSSSP
jgi:hypothetical protein